MTHNINDISLMPWQSIILTWVGGSTIALFVLSLVLMILFSVSKKKNVQDKIHTISCIVFGAFIIALMIANIAAISFLVDVELGWKLSLLAGASVILGIISIISMLLGAFTGMATPTFFIWMFLAMLSFASVVNLVMMSVGST